MAHAVKCGNVEAFTSNGQVLMSGGLLHGGTVGGLWGDCAGTGAYCRRAPVWGDYVGTMWGLCGDR